MTMLDLCAMSECIYSVGSLAVCLGWSLVQRCPRKKRVSVHRAFYFLSMSLLHFSLLQWVVFLFCCVCLCFQLCSGGTGWQFCGCITALKFHSRMQFGKQCAQASHACCSPALNHEVPSRFSFPQLRLTAVPEGQFTGSSACSLVAAGVAVIMPSGLHVAANPVSLSLPAHSLVHLWRWF